MGLQYKCGGAPPLPKVMEWLVPPTVAVLSLFALYRYLRWRNRNKIQDKVVLITGASSGIGKCCAVTFYKNGAKVILASRSEANLLKVKAELVAIGQGQEPEIVTVDMSDYDSIRQAARQVLSRHSRVDVLVNNAGQSYRGAASATDIGVHEQLMKVNYFGQIVLTQELLPSMIRNGGGDIAVVSSVQGKVAVPFRSAYGASKHALECYFDALRAEHYDQNIRVLITCPGYTKTPLSLNALVGDGSAYGKMDDNLAKGMAPEYVAEQIVLGIEYDKKHLILGPIHHVLACYVGNMWWNLMAFIMRRKAREDRKIFADPKSKSE